MGRRGLAGLLRIGDGGTLHSRSRRGADSNNRAWVWAPATGAFGLAIARRCLACGSPVADAGDRATIFRRILPTIDNFSGMIDRRPLDAAIAAHEKERAARGIVSQALATPPS